MDLEFVKWVATLGVGGVLAGMMFFVYRKDSKEAQSRWQGQSEMLMQVVKENTEAFTANAQIVASATVMIEMLVRRLNGTHERPFPNG